MQEEHLALVREKNEIIFLALTTLLSAVYFQF
jgi:hypothetical protein